MRDGEEGLGDKKKEREEIKKKNMERLNTIYEVGESPN